MKACFNSRLGLKEWSQFFFSVFTSNVNFVFWTLLDRLVRLVHLEQFLLNMAKLIRWSLEKNYAGLQEQLFSQSSVHIWMRDTSLQGPTFRWSDRLTTGKLCENSPHVKDTISTPRQSRLRFLGFPILGRSSYQGKDEWEKIYVYPFKYI